MDPSLLKTLLGLAVLLPLFSFFAIWLFATRLGRSAAYFAVGAIGGACILSFLSLFIWLSHHWPSEAAHHDTHGAHDSGGSHSAPHDDHKHDGSPSDKHSRSHPRLALTLVALQAPHPETAAIQPESATAAGAADNEHSTVDSHAGAKIAYTGEYYTFGEFGPLRVTISYYIDALTVLMFCMVTLVATLIHCYAIGYMADELTDVTDKEVATPSGHYLHRPGRFPRFFQYLSLFCFSMLGLVLAGNIAMVFIFWELVGICSYFLIGFYIERKSASTAANKAFIVNRIGDFGMIIGLLALWSSLGTFSFGDIERVDSAGNKIVEQGIFSQVRPAPDHELVVPAGMVAADLTSQQYSRDPAQRALAAEAIAVYRDHGADPVGWKSAESEIASRYAGRGYGYWLLVVAGIGIFCGCVGKSAQFPLHTWLPDAMEGPTPVSALVHSATMVAAGVYLVGRFYPVFAPEVLLVIATIGCITMLLGATIAFTAVDIKRVLAYSTVSQLGLMMLALGVGGWLAGVMHLITHAFFKSMLFMCSGSVIHAVHTNDLRKMGGLFSKMPVTAITMLIGCLAIAGVAVPFVLGFSGHYSKDAILEQAMSFAQTKGNPAYASIFFILALGGAALTSCYMFRMWFMTFVGQPRDPERYDHAHESPPTMYVPLVILAVLATAVAWDFRLIGAAIVAGAFFILRGVEKGWFKPTAHGHGGPGHDNHGHDNHGHDNHGHDDHGHDDHGHAHGGHAHEEHAHAHGDRHAASPESPLSWRWVAVMLLATIAGGLFTKFALPVTKMDNLSLANLIEQARPAGTLADAHGQWVGWTWPDERKSHADAIRIPVTLMATGTWLGGIFLAAALYWWGYLSPEDVRRQFAPAYTLLWNKYYFDELYDAIFVQPTHVISRFIAGIDKNWIDGLIDFLAGVTVWFSRAWDLIIDRGIVDSVANLTATWTYSLGNSLRAVQTGRIRQYVMFIVVGAIAIFILISFFWSPTLPASTITP